MEFGSFVLRTIFLKDETQRLVEANKAQKFNKSRPTANKR